MAVQSDEFRQRLLELLEQDPLVRRQVHALVTESEVLKELKAFREDSNQRFEAMDRRFKAQQLEIKQLREDMDRRFEAQQEEIKNLRKDMQDGFRSVHQLMTTLGQRWGIQTEDAVRTFMQQFVASEFGVEAKRWRKGDTELDIVIKDGVHAVIEVKAATYADDVRRFAQHVAAYTEAVGKEPTRKIIVTAHANSWTYQAAREIRIEVISG